MKKHMVLLVILFTFSFMLMACSDAEQENNNSNNQENRKDNKVEDVSDSDSSKDTRDEAELSVDDIEAIVDENYQEIIEVINENESTVSELFANHAETIDVSKFMESGLDPNHPFYKEMDQLFDPQVRTLVTKQGMEDFINSEFLLFMNPRNTTPFSPTYDRLEVVKKNDKRFQIKQTATLADEPGSGQAIYIVDYAEVDGIWKFSGAKRKD